MFFANYFSHCLSLFLQFFSPVQIVLPHLLQIFIKQDFSFLAILSLFPFSEYLKNMLLKEIRIRVADIDKLESILHCYFISASQVIHQKLYQVKKVTRFQSSLVKNTSFVHEGELVLIDLSVKIFIDFPDPLVNFRFVVREAEFSQHANHVLLVNGQTKLCQIYAFLLNPSLSALLLLTLSPQMRRKVLRRRSASIFSMDI